jgi:hypothetical protein
MPDSSLIGLALVEKLAADGTLTALLPDGVWRKVAPKNAKRFAIVSLIDGVDVGQFGGRAYEDALYLVEARVLSTVVGGNVYAAAARIEVLLEDQPLDVAGYGWMTMHREEPIEDTDVDAVDTTIQWHRAGGHYRVQMSVGYVAPPLAWVAGGWIA